MNHTTSQLEAALVVADFDRSIETVPAVKHSGTTPSVAVGRIRHRNPIASVAPGDVFRGIAITQADIDTELQILDCAAQSALEERRGNSEAAMNWSQAMQRAIAARRPEIVKAWEDEERERLDGGCFTGEFLQGMGGGKRA